MQVPRLLLCVSFVCLIGPILALAGEMRTWTRVDGKTVEAEFVGLDGDTVEIKNEKGEYRVPLASLSPEDQEYARSQAKPQPAARPAKMKIETREWQIGGEKVKARYVRIRDLDVQVMRGNKLQTISLLGLSDDDAAYLYELLESRGDLEKLKDNPSVNVLVSKVELNRSSEQLFAERMSKREPRPSPVTGVPVENTAPTIPETPLETPLAGNETPAVVKDNTLPPVVDAAKTASEPAPPGLSYTPPQYPPNSIVVPTGTPALTSPTTPPPTTTTAPVPSITLPPEVAALKSKDPWERDQAVMRSSNQAAYYFLAGILTLLVVFGPVIWALQRRG